MVKLISPIDGSVIAERSSATQAEVDAALKVVQTAQRQWRATPVAERARFCLRAVDALRGDGRRDRRRAGAADGAARAVWSQRSVADGGAGPAHDRHRAGGAGRSPPRARRRFSPLRATRAARHGVRDRALELSVPVGGQFGGAGADGGERRAAQARGPDAAGGRTISGGIRSGRVAAGSLSKSGARSRAIGADHPLGPRAPGEFHRLSRGGP